MKTQNATLIAIARNIHAAANINVLFRSDAAARRNDYYIDTQKSLFAQIAGLPVDSVEEEAAKLIAIALMPLKEEGRVSRMARPVATMPVVAPRLTLTGVVPVEVEDELSDWSPGVGRAKRVIGYNVTRVRGGVEMIEFRPKGSRRAILADWSPSRRALWVCPQGECSGNPCGTEFEIEDGVDGACPKCGTVLHAVSCK